MKKILCLFLLIVNSVITDLYAQNVAYIRGGVEPWNLNGNVNAMDDVFGVGNWKSERFTSVDPQEIFSQNYKFVFIEGGNEQTQEMVIFLQANYNLIQSWVANGNSLLINSATNMLGTYSVGFGVTFTRNLSGLGNPVGNSHPIFNGTFSPSYSSQYQGSAFAHDVISGSGLSPIILGDNNNTKVILAEMDWGQGIIMFGGLTLPWFDQNQVQWLPQPNVANLHRNLLQYLAGEGEATLITNALNNLELCSSSALSVQFTITGSFNSGNSFTVQLSNASGSFTTPVTIGSLSGTTSGTISAMIPANTPGGSGYRVRVVSSDPVVTGSDNGSDITINALPTAVLSGGGTICPDGSANLSVVLTGAGPWSVTYTDGTTPVTVSSITNSPYTIPVSPGSTKTYSLVSASDANCNATSLSGTALVTVNSVPELTVPVLASVSNNANICGASVTFAATATGSPTPSITYKIGETTITSPHVFPVGTTTVTATATNSCGSDIETFAVTVTNVAPELSVITPGTINPVPINTAFSASATVTDNNLQSGTWTWDDGTTFAGIINGSTISGSRTYNATGVYTIGLEVKDACNITDQAIYQYVVVYDPSGGFVTGGGWITSPQNTDLYYMQEPGRANFGFVSKYVKGATKPTGETNFQFQTANLHFLSSSYEWLVVSGATARYKGVGTINGSGNYGFIISAVDGQVTGGGGSDKFRIKIWDKSNNDVVVYDNNLSATGDDALAETIISGGSIVVHEAKKTSSSKSIVAATEPWGSSFYSYPTAFSTKTTIAFKLDRAEDYVLEVFDMKGALVKKLSAGIADANKLYEIELDGNSMREGVYITRLTTASNVRSLKTVLKR